MTKIIPFKAVRPTRSKVGLVASRPYESYTAEERESRMHYNPFSFLHIINPGFKYDQIITGEERYNLVKNRYLEFKEDDVFIQDERPSLYVYKIVNRDNFVFSGIIALAHAVDYENNIIKKHEDTLKQREQTFKTYLKTVGFNAEPVLMTYQDNEVISNIVEKIQQQYPEYEFTMTYRDTHYLWKLDDEATIQIIQNEFKKLETVYIADGHHRCASSYLLYQEEKAANQNHSGNEPYNYFMCFFLPESHLKIYEFNRLIKDLNGLSKETFLVKLDAFFKIENQGNIPFHPKNIHEFSMYLDGEFYTLNLRKSNFQFNSALDQLDAYILYKTVLNPILGIDDLRHNNRIDYSNGKNELINIKTQVDSGLFKVGFGLFPTNIEQIKAIADEGLTMPPKSTYILPKLRSGLTIYEF